MSAGDDRGATLVVALVIMMLGATILAAVVLFAQSSLRSSDGYRNRTERVQEANDALTFTMTAIRRPPALIGSTDGELQPRDGLEGLDGQTSTRSYESMVVTCTGQPGSGAAEPGTGFADRTVRCEVRDGDDGLVLDATVRLVDDHGTNLGSDVQLLDVSTPS